MGFSFVKRTKGLSMQSQRTGTGATMGLRADWVGDCRKKSEGLQYKHKKRYPRDWEAHATPIASNMSTDRFDDCR